MTHARAGHDHDLRGAQSKALWIALTANATFMIVEFVSGVVLGSLALVADAGHMLSDVGALAVALVAHKLLVRPPSQRHTYGLQRAEVVGAQLNAVVLLGLALWLFVEAIQRLQDPRDVSGPGLALVAVGGLLVNLGSFALLRRAQGSSLNMRGAVLHMALDAAGSVAALAAGIGIVLWDAGWLDPAATVVIVALLVWSGARLLTDATHVLLEGVPRGLDVGAVEAALASDVAVDSVHHLHIWNLASDVPALSAHIVVGSEKTLHEAQLHSDRLKSMLGERFGIEHATLELECHSCATQT
ncbi:MAG: cation diffusion facilitator family transporter [Actinomycetota bacterium]|nr:cation diffusion facilitator family transporter [Actinomycetota bacterium]